MDLISCAKCGIVIDKHQIAEPDIYDDNDEVILELAIWDDDKYVATISCPCCDSRINYLNGKLMGG